MNERNDTVVGGEMISISLPEFLNIFFKGRLLILAITALGVVAGLVYGGLATPLYLGSVQVRPGVVSYNEEGHPIRGWALKDVSQWFERARFWDDMKHLEEFKDDEIAPIIEAEFIPTGLQWTPGGNIITLNNLSPSQERSQVVLEHAIASFNRQAKGGDNDSDLDLALAAARQRMKNHQYAIELLVGDEEVVNIEIKGKRGQLKIIEGEVRRIDSERARLLESNVLRQKAVKAVEGDLVLARTRLKQAQLMLDVALKDQKAPNSNAVGPGGDENPVTNVLLNSARREQAGRVVELLDSVGLLEIYLFEGQVKIDSLSSRIITTNIDLSDLDLMKEVDLVQQREDVLNEISLLEIKLNRELPYTKKRLQNNIATEEMRIKKLRALEQVSPIQITDEPVRPRKIRATAILTVLAFFASLALVLIREFYFRNRAVITAR
ncbi:MAG: hypothetical protein KOO60_12095 [Gemmatimonadales bacterium]|nr:hypothetical protein [Gemmatimonadales bacterium]